MEWTDDERMRLISHYASQIMTRYEIIGKTRLMRPDLEKIYECTEKIRMLSTWNASFLNANMDKFRKDIDAIKSYDERHKDAG